MATETLTRNKSSKKKRAQERQDRQAAFMEKAKELLPKIKEEHAAIKSAFESGLEHAIKCGGYLAEMRKLFKHGNWKEWVESICKFTSRTARSYIRVFKFKDQLPKRQEISFRRAIYALRRDPTLPPVKKASKANKAKLQITKEEFENAKTANHLEVPEKTLEKFLKDLGIVIK